MRTLALVGLILALAGCTASSPLEIAGAVAGPSGGPGPVNLGCADDASLTDAERQLVRMPADSWLEVPGTAFGDFCAAHEPAGAHATSGCGAVISAWGGGVWDPIRRSMILWGGGHDDYWGNEVYGFSTRTLRWELLVPGTPITSAGELAETLRDGAPVSRHTYDGLAFLVSEDRLFAFGGASAPSGGSTGLTWTLDLGQQRWTQRATRQPLPPTSEYYMATAADDAGGRVFMRNQNGVWRYDVVADAWTRLADAGVPPLWPEWAEWHYRRGVFDPSRGIFFTLGGRTASGAPDLFAWDTAAGAHVSGQWVTTGGDDIAGADAPGADLDPTADAIVAWAGGPARVLDLGTKAWTTKSGAGAPAAPVRAGTFGRFRYLSAYNVFVLVNEPGENVFFYKHTAGCGR